jgi:hypothetical protein
VLTIFWILAIIIGAIGVGMTIFGSPGHRIIGILLMLAVGIAVVALTPVVS